MMYAASAFFAGFSLQELVKRNYRWDLSGPSGGMGVVGGGSGITGAAQSAYSSSCSKSETFTCPVYSAGDARFDESDFMECLARDVEKQIVDTGARITARAKPDGRRFSFDYSQEGIRGSVVISGNMITIHYVLNAHIEEKAEGPTARWSLPDTRFGVVQPEGDYYVVALTSENPLAQGDEFHNIGVRSIRESVNRIRRGISGEQLSSMPSAEVFSLPIVSQRLRERLREISSELALDPPDEYQKYEKVFFLNATALGMYRAAGIDLDVLKKVSAAEVPRQCSRTLRGPYLPME